MPDNQIRVDADIDGFITKIHQAMALLRQLKDEAASVTIGGGIPGSATASAAAQAAAMGGGGARANVAASASAHVPGGGGGGTFIIGGQSIDPAQLQATNPAYYQTLLQAGAFNSPASGASFTAASSAAVAGSLNFSQFSQRPFGGFPVGSAATFTINGQQAQAQQMQAQQAQVAAAMAMTTTPASLPTSALERIGGGALRGALFAVGESAGQYFQVLAGEQMAGRPDIIGRSATGYGLAGGLLGAAVGSFFGPFGGLIGAGVGNQFGSALGTFVASGTEAEAQRRQSLQAVGGLSGLLAGDYRGGRIPGIFDGPSPYFSPGNEAAQRIERKASAQAQDIRERYFYSIDSAGMYHRGGNAALAMTDPQLAAAYSSTYEALLAGGINPEAGTAYEGGISRGDPAARRRSISALRGRTTAGNLIEGMVNQGIDLLTRRDTGPGTEPLYEYLAENADKYYGASGVNVLNSVVLPILASSQKTRGNYADILTQFGATSTAQYAQVISPFGTAPGVSLPQLLQAQVGVQQGQRAAQFAAVQARGSGQAALTAFGSQVSALGGLPGGTESLAYAQAGAQFREAGATAFEQLNITRNEIPLTQLGNQRALLQILPFAPASMMRNALATISAERQQLSDLTRYEQTRRASGQLSEAEELQLLQRENAARLGIGESISQLQEGIVNKLPEMAAGRPSFTGRYTSINLAASAVNMAQGYFRGFGAETGGQRARQDSLIRDLGLSPNDTTFPTRTGGLNTDPAILSLLSKIADGISKMASTSGGGNSSANPTRAASAPNGSSPDSQPFNSNYGSWRN
jgi:hypothetical protein